MTTEYKKPLPKPDEDNKPYWDAARENRFVLMQCQDCGTWKHRFTRVCANCLSENLVWKEASGKGKIWSWVVAHRPLTKGYEDDVPYPIICVELEEGPRMTSSIVDCEADEIYIGMPVEVVFDPVTPEITLPKFRPVR